MVERERETLKVKGSIPFLAAMNMNETLKKKYRTRHEPDSKKNRAGFKNSPQWGAAKGGNQGKSHTKKIAKPTGSGRTIGNMIRRFSLVQDKKKK